MATFTWVPEYPPTERSAPRVRKTALGDGYEHRVRFGLNTNLKTWDLEFNARGNTEAAEIRTFLDARGATESFAWTPPFFSATAGQYVCDTWDITTPAYGINNVRAVFRQVPEPS